MLLFWILAAALLLIATVFILLPLIKKQPRENYSEAGHQARYRQRLQEIDAEIENGLISAQEAGAIKRQLQLELLDWDKNNRPAATADKGHAGAVIAILIFIPAFAIGLYQYLGRPESIAQIEFISRFQQAETEAQKLAAFDKMLAQIERRLTEQPGDIERDLESWRMLANSYNALQKYPEAARAVANLYRLRPDDPDILFRYCRRPGNGQMTACLRGRPAELIRQGLAIDPENISGLWLAGLAANGGGDSQAAIGYWERLLPRLEPGFGTRTAT